MNLLVWQINQKYEDIKYLMKDTWIKLISLENSLGELQCAKIPLICYGDKDSNGQITFANLDSYSCESKKPLPSVVEWMKQFGYIKLDNNLILKLLATTLSVYKS